MGKKTPKKLISHSDNECKMRHAFFRQLNQIRQPMSRENAKDAKPGGQ